MKKIVMLLAVAAMAVSANAQKTAITSGKAFDNVYVGINGGVAAPAKGYSVFNTLTPELGLRIGKNFTTVFGLAIDADMHFATKPAIGNTKTWVDNSNISLLGTANLSNLFAGYKGEPRVFEVSALYGFGWGHVYGIDVKYNAVSSKVALDFAFNLGKAKAWQIYIEPSLTYGLQDYTDGYADPTEFGFQYNLKNADLALKLGVNYKFGCSNGKHNFAIEQVRDQAEIDGLNAKINDLRNQLSAAEADCNKNLEAKDAEIARLKKALSDCENKPVQVVKNTANLQPTVVFGLGKSVVEKSQEANVSLIANYMKAHKDAKVKISGYASPEGSKELNQKLSENRANAVKDLLVNKYKISADRLEAEGLGATDKLFDEVEFNRVAVFNDMNK